MSFGKNKKKAMQFYCLILWIRQIYSTTFRWKRNFMFAFQIKLYCWKKVVNKFCELKYRMCAVLSYVKRHILNVILLDCCEKSHQISIQVWRIFIYFYINTHTSTLAKWFIALLELHNIEVQVNAVTSWLLIY